MSSQPIVVGSHRARVPVVVPSGARGLRGPAGIVLVRHDADADYPRPNVPGIILWRGSVQPNNWDVTQDLWLQE